MKTIIAGGRDYSLTKEDYARLDALPITEVVCGGARGADQGGLDWAVARRIPLAMFPADWDAHGKSAGAIRNTQMAEYAEALVAFWDGKSRGTEHMIKVATKKGLKVDVVRYNKERQDVSND